MPSKTILIADDDLSLLKAMQVRLESVGFEVVVTQDSYQTVDKARRISPDLLILDINMPAGSGFTVQQRIKNLPELADIPVIYITGEDPDSVDDIAIRMGAYSILHKPFDASVLTETVKHALGLAVV